MYKKPLGTTKYSLLLMFSFDGLYITASTFEVRRYQNALTSAQTVLVSLSVRRQQRRGFRPTYQMHSLIANHSANMSINAIN